MSRMHIAVAVLLVLGPVDVPVLAQTDDAQLKREVAKLFELGKSLKTRAEAKAQFERLQELAPDDGRVGYAYVLVQLKHRHYREAAELLEDVLGKSKNDGKDNLDAWEVKIWLSTLTKRYGTAVAEMRQLRKFLSSRQSSKIPHTQRQEVAEFLGRMCGYLEGIAKQQTRPTLRPDDVRSITAKMTDSEKAAFDRGRNDIIGRLSNQTERTDSLKAEAIRAEAKRRGMRIEELDRRRKEAAAQLAAMEGRREELLEKRKAEIDEITKQEREALAELRTAGTRAVGLRRELAVVDSRIAKLIDRVEHPDTNPIERRHLLDEISRWEIIRARQRTELAGQDTRLAGLRERTAAVRQRKADTENRYDRELGRIDGLRRTMDSIDRDKSLLLTAPIRGNTRRVRAHKSRAIALTNYIKLPIVLDAEKKRLLESFR